MNEIVSSVIAFIIGGIIYVASTVILKNKRKKGGTKEIIEEIMNNIEKTKAEIEKLKAEYEKIILASSTMTSECLVSMGKVEVLNKVIAFIHSLPEEKPSEDLEKEAEKHAKTKFYTRADDFIAGAEWQKEQMFKGAKDGYVNAIIIHNDGDEEHYAVTYPNGERPHSITDKVKIIIL